MKKAINILAVLIMLAMAGCGMFHPRAQEFYDRAKGKTGVETGIALAELMEQTIQALISTPGPDANLSDLHDQFHALHHVFCDMTDAQRATTAYAHAVTLEKELRAIFHRLWKVRQDSKLRNLHLGLLAARLQEFKLALQGITA